MDHLDANAILEAVTDTINPDDDDALDRAETIASILIHLATSRPTSPSTPALARPVNRLEQ